MRKQLFWVLALVAIAAATAWVRPRDAEVRQRDRRSRPVR